MQQIIYIKNNQLQVKLALSIFNTAILVYLGLCIHISGNFDLLNFKIMFT